MTGLPILRYLFDAHWHAGCSSVHHRQLSYIEGSQLPECGAASIVCIIPFTSRFQRKSQSYWLSVRAFRPPQILPTIFTTSRRLNFEYTPSKRSLLKTSKSSLTLVLMSIPPMILLQTRLKSFSNGTNGTSHWSRAFR